MSHAVQTPTCDHCGYDLAGIAAVDGFALCPECGKRTDITRVPPPVSPWWRMPVAVLAGTATMTLGFVVLVSLIFGGYGKWRDNTGPAAMFVCVLLGGVVSMAIVWRDRVAFLQWEAPSARIRPRTYWFLLIDCVFYCILNLLVLSAAAFWLSFFFGR
jgi:hypothetical protein